MIISVCLSSGHCTQSGFGSTIEALEAANSHYLVIRSRNQQQPRKWVPQRGFEAICIRFGLLVRRGKFTCQPAVRTNSNEDLSQPDRFLTKDSFAAINA